MQRESQKGILLGEGGKMIKKLGTAAREDIEKFLELKQKQNGMWIPLEEGNCETVEFYYKGRLMIEYLMNVKKWTYDQILKDKHSEDEIYTEMIGWTNKK